MTSDCDTSLPVPGEPSIRLEHVTVRNDDAPDECAIFPRNATERQLTTAWIAAQDDAFVALESMR
ncbi:DUF7511 domain-containing protein [Halopiger goleimassiliensis]|uniref:DUF7511 domain-containing protein n=1 Tax=Halopiger goleimassiliensis TaxID=1293048 RepID=UPI000677DEC5|nr:hypothetical protein [Halopiger goleimassiliensis]